MDLLVSLGHNSSVIAIDNNEIICGYEEERFSRLKSVSTFPLESLNRIIKYYGSNNLKNIYVSHWFDDFNFYGNNHKKIQNKYFNKEIIKKYNLNLITLNENFTHHDAHAHSALCFYNSYSKYNNSKHIIVIDGFGNKQEVISIYYYDGNNINCIKKVFGYKNSLALLYQTATSFCGMIENQDEYKFLGYESHIKEILTDSQIDNINEIINKNCLKSFIDNFILNHQEEYNPDDIYINMEELLSTKKYFNDIFESILNLFSPNVKIPLYENRIIIGYYIQTYIEKYLELIIYHYDIKNVLLSGGIFYNVKLNNSILKNVDKISIIPVTGDQGAAIGLYYKNNDLKFGNLLIGKRKESNSLFNDYDINEISKFILNKGILNYVANNMEFGPRALCNTSTLALPIKENVDIINKLNGRNNIMPMAPVMLEKNLSYFFNKEQYDKVVGSLNYMIITLDYFDKFNNLAHLKYSYEGVMHKYPLNDIYSGRPQIITEKNSFIYKLLVELDKEGIKSLINTSFNIHGKPIVFTKKDALDDYNFQINNSINLDSSKIKLLLDKEIE